MNETYFYRRKLPHWLPPEGTIFVTYRLFGSVPMNVLKDLKLKYRQALEKVHSKYGLPPEKVLRLLPPKASKKLRSILNKRKRMEGKRYFKNLDEFLDKNLNEPYWLKLPEIAELVAESIHFSDGKYYTLWAYCIMSNHVHLLVTMLPDAPILSKVLQDSKKYTARNANQLLGRTGQFWDNESYDHLVRNKKKAFKNIFRYILQNPVKAKLVKNWEEWPWTYCHPSLRALAEPG